MATTTKPILDPLTAGVIRRDLAWCLGRVSRSGVEADRAALREVCRRVAEVQRSLEGHLGEVVLAGPPRLADDGCGSAPFIGASAATDVGPSLGLLDGGD